MKPIQIMMDEKLLAQLDADGEVRRVGRSAVFRKIVAEYLKYRQHQEIARKYRQAYASNDAGLGAEFDEWENQGIWPKE